MPNPTFFDEADALFGKRIRTSDPHDRHANIETRYLLQSMEGYEGMTTSPAIQTNKGVACL